MSSRNTAAVLLFGGQGSQKPGMGADFYLNSPAARAIYDQAFLQRPDLRQILNPEMDHELLAQTNFAQPAVVLHALSVWRFLSDKGLEIAATMGISVGEFVALTAASVLRPEDTVEICLKRTSLMSERLKRLAVTGENGGMLAVLGLNEAELDAALKNRSALQSQGLGPEVTEGVSMANLNSERQIVLSGNLSKLQLLSRYLMQNGARKTVFLDVEGAFHSAIFGPEVESLFKVLEAVEWQSPKCSVPLNILGRAEESLALWPILMSHQMAASLRVHDCLESLLAAGHRHFIECSQTPVLIPLLRKLDPGLELHHIGTLAAAEDYLKNYH